MNMKPRPNIEFVPSSLDLTKKEGNCLVCNELCDNEIAMIDDSPAPICDACLSSQGKGILSRKIGTKGWDMIHGLESVHIINKRS